MPGITYKQRPEITREQELAVLAEVYRLALEAHRRKNAAGFDQNPDGDDAKKGSLKHDVRANPSLPR